MLFDAHFHVIDPHFPLVPNQGYLPPAFDADAYRREVAGLDVRGGFVKATGFGRLDFEVAPVLQRLVAEISAGVVFGTDLPSTRAKRRFAASDVDLVRETLGEALAARVLHENGRAIHRI